MKNFTHQGHKFTSCISDGVTKFKVNNGNCHVMLKSRFCFTPDQLVRIKQIVETTGYIAPADRQSILVRIALELMKWFPSEYNHTTISADYGPSKLGMNKLLKIDIN